MGFFDFKKTKVGDPSTFDVRASRRLVDALHKNVGLQRPYSASAWAKEFAKLRRLDGASKERILQALKWYVAHIGEDFVPVAHSAKAFRAKFTSIEVAAKRAQGPALVAISKEAKAVADRVTRKHWPKGSDAQVAQVIQKSMHAYEEFLDRKRHLTASMPWKHVDEKAAKRVVGFLAHLQSRLPTTPHFVELWINTVHASVANWEAWSGDLNRFVFKTDSKLFQTMGREWASRYCGIPKRWDEFMEILNGCPEA